MHWTNKIRRPFIALEGEDGGSGGGSLVATKVTDSAGDDDAGEQSQGDGDDGEDADSADDGEDDSSGDDGDDAGDDADESDDDDSRSSAAPTAEEFEAWAKANGWVKPDDKGNEGEKKSDPSPDSGYELSPRDQAYAEAERLGKDYDWAENRRDQIIQERQEIQREFDSIPARLPQITQEFEQAGLPKEAALPYLNNLATMRKGGFDYTKDPSIRRTAIALTLGEMELARLEKGGNRDRDEAPKPKKASTPTGGNVGERVSVSGLSKGDQQFLQRWQTEKNGGKPASPKQLAKMKEEGLIG